MLWLQLIPLQWKLPCLLANESESPALYVFLILSWHLISLEHKERTKLEDSLSGELRSRSDALSVMQNS